MHFHLVRQPEAIPSVSCDVNLENWRRCEEIEISLSVGKNVHKTPQGNCDRSRKKSQSGFQVYKNLRIVIYHRWLLLMEII